MTSKLGPRFRRQTLTFLGHPNQVLGETSSWVIFLDVLRTSKSGPQETSGWVIFLDVPRTSNSGPQGTSGWVIFWTSFGRFKQVQE